MNTKSISGARWTEEEKAILREQWVKVKKVKTLAATLGKTTEAVVKKAESMRLPRKRIITRWTPERKAELARLYPKTPNKVIADMLGVNHPRTVQSKAWKLGLKKQKPERKAFKHVQVFKPKPIQEPEKLKQWQRPPAVYSNQRSLY